ncbi:MAG: UvrD-helicase domain-containing protein [Candidatus Zixiibacteriota bacterium]
MTSSRPSHPETDPLLAELNPPQREAVTHGSGPLLILAGAGSGKTRVITYRIAHLLRLGVPPWSILAVTFTNKAAGEMKGRVRELVGDTAQAVWVSTFHSFAARFLRQEYQAAGLPRGFTIYDDDDKTRLLKRTIEELNLPIRTFVPGMVKSLISAAKDKLQDATAVARLARDDFDRRIAEIYAAYQRQLADAGAVDFDDLIVRTVNLLKEREDVRRRWQGRFHHVLVDEYQDTNIAQGQLVSILAEPERNICVVGDDDQSIYAWRGATIENILGFARHYPDVITVRLEQNYRSRPNILEAAHAVVAANLNRHPKKLWTDKRPGRKITLILTPDDWSEADLVIGRIRLLCRRDGLAPSDCVVLYRTNAQSRVFEEACRRSSLPYVLVGGVKFYQRAEIKDVLAYAQLMVNGNDSVALLRIINRPSRGIGETSQEKLAAARKIDGRPWLDFLADKTAVTATVGARAAGAVASFSRLLSDLHEARTRLGIADWCRHLLDTVDFKTAWRDDDPLIAEGREENVEELVAAIAEYEATAEAPSLSGFLEQAALVTDVDNYETRAEAVTLMTLHAAKGLEFPAVFITGLEEGLFPLLRSMEKPETLEEERRLFYVGATRAKEQLYLSYARTRRRLGPVASLKSRFIEEIPREYLDVENFIPETELDAGGLGYDAPGRTWRTGFQDPQRRARAVARRDAEPQPNRAGIAQSLQAGTIIRHPKFGEGEVLAIHGMGDGTTCEIAFRAGFTKTLMVRFAPLEILRN